MPAETVENLREGLPGLGDGQNIGKNGHVHMIAHMNMYKFAGL